MTLSRTLRRHLRPVKAHWLRWWTASRPYPPSPTITPAFRALNAQLHRDMPSYGANAGRHAPAVRALVREYTCATLLDYGCGKGTLRQALGGPMAEYDPAIPGKDAPPAPAELVVCADVLEHIEPECIDAVLDDLQRVTQRVGFFVIHTGPATKVYADGRNTHLLQRPQAWWAERLGQRFTVQGITPVGVELHVVVTPR